jgi:RNA polymerase sigma factor (sigma-70 family)
VARCLEGDGAAWETLARRYHRLVYAIALRAGLNEDAAADVFQTVFTRLLQHLPRIAHPERLQAWIVTTARRETLLQQRRDARTVSMAVADGDIPDAAEPEVADDALLPDEALDELQQLARVRLAIDTIDQRCRRLLLALFSDDEPPAYDDLARRLDMPLGSVGPTRSRCLAKLRRAVG